MCAASVKMRVNRLFHWFGMCLLAMLCVTPPGLASELEERARIKEQVTQAFFAKDYATLEALGNRYASPTERTASGLWKQTMLFFAFIDLNDYDWRDVKFWRFAEENALGWIAAHPDSASAHIAYAELQYAHARSYRGNGYASTVPKENWKPYRDYLVKANNYLGDKAGFAARDPRYQDLRLIIANELPVPEAEFAELARAALESNPGYYQLYFTIMNHYLPQWGGNTRLVEGFARAAVDHTRATDGDGLYARIYWSASQFQFGDDLFTRSEANWADMKRGIADVLARYDDDWNRNNFARFACLAGDRELAGELLRKIADRPLPAAWRNRVVYEKCRSWVMSP